jgi:hypothetical protein
VQKSQKEICSFADVFIPVGRLVDYCAHFRHGFNGDDTLDRKVRLIIDIIARQDMIYWMPAAPTIISNMYSVNSQINSLITIEQR